MKSFFFTNIQYIGVIMKLVKAVLAVSLGAAIAASSMSAVQAKQITIGFSQIGAESEWRTANTNDVKAGFRPAASIA